jgi:hypothetical protein
MPETRNAVTIMECAIARGLRQDADGSCTAQDLADVGFDMIGGCCSCHATIAAYNAYPSQGGFWCCSGCVGDFGFETTEDFELWCKEQDEEESHEVQD